MLEFQSNRACHKFKRHDGTNSCFQKSINGLKTLRLKIVLHGLMWRVYHSMLGQHILIQGFLLNGDNYFILKIPRALIVITFIFVLKRKSHILL